jgi:PEP-CTERM motif
MTTPQRLLHIAVFSLATLTLSIPASADSYRIIDLGSTPNSGLWGLAKDGTVVIQYESDIPGLILWATSSPDGQGITLPYPPNLDYDGGTQCNATTSSGITPDNDAPIVCNGSREVYLGFFTPPGSSQLTSGIFTGPDPSDLLPGFTVPGFMNGLALNSSGDFALAFDFDSEEQYYEAVDLTSSTVPEPGTLSLLGIGTLTLIGAVRRRLA